MGSFRSLQSLLRWFPLTFCDHEKRNKQFFRFFNKDYHLMVRAAKIFSVLGESKDASFHNFQHGLAASLPVAMKNGRFNMANTVAVSMFESISF